MIGHFEVKNENKYLVLDEIDENKEILKKYEYKGFTLLILFPTI